jgi:hypothetical protein
MFLNFFEDLLKFLLTFMKLFNNSENLFSKPPQKSYSNCHPEYEYRKPPVILK